MYALLSELITQPPILSNRSLYLLHSRKTTLAGTEILPKASTETMK